MAALQAETVGFRPEEARNSSVASTRRSIAPERMSAAAAAVDRDAVVGEHAAGEGLLAHQHDLADREAPRRRSRTARSCPWRGRPRSTRAASSRRGSASGRCAGRRGRPGGSRTAGAGRRVAGLADAAERGAAEDAGALDEPLGDEVLRVQAERGAGGGQLLGALVRRAARRRRRPWRSCAPGGRTGGPWRRGQVGLGGARRGCGRPWALASALASSVPSCSRPRRLAPRVGVLLGRALLGRRVGLGDDAEVPVGVRVAVDVLEDHVAAEALARAELDDLAVVDGDHGRAGLGEDLDVAAGLVGLDGDGGVAPLVLRSAFL